MPPKTITSREWNPLLMTRLILIAGVMGVAFQILPEMEILTFMTTVGALGGLVGSSQTFDERETQLLWKSFGLAFQWSLIGFFFLYTIVVVIKWLAIADGLLIFLGDQCLGFTVSIMCMLLGVAGSQIFRTEA
jgi:hypothetical protein